MDGPINAKRRCNPDLKMGAVILSAAKDPRICFCLSNCFVTLLSPHRFKPPLSAHSGRRKLTKVAGPRTHNDVLLIRKTSISIRLEPKLQFAERPVRLHVCRFVPKRVSPTKLINQLSQPIRNFLLARIKNWSAGQIRVLADVPHMREKEKSDHHSVRLCSSVDQRRDHHA